MQEQSVAPETEWVDIVDENNDVVATASREQMRAKGLRHRATYILVHDGMGKILVQRRSQSKDLYPGLLDATAGGVVIAGEHYHDSSRREAEEELGIASVPFADHGLFYFENDDCRVWGALYSCVSHGPFALQEDEIEGVDWLTPEEIIDNAFEFTPDTMKAFYLWHERNEEAESLEVAKAPN